MDPDPLRPPFAPLLWAHPLLLPLGCHASPRAGPETFLLKPAFTVSRVEAQEAQKVSPTRAHLELVIWFSVPASYYIKISKSVLCRPGSEHSAHCIFFKGTSGQRGGATMHMVTHFGGLGCTWCRFPPGHIPCIHGFQVTISARTQGAGVLKTLLHFQIPLF